MRAHEGRGRKVLLWGTFPAEGGMGSSSLIKGDQAHQGEKPPLEDEDSHGENMLLGEGRCWLGAAQLNEASKAELSTSCSLAPAGWEQHGEGREGLTSSILGIQPFTALAFPTAQWGILFQGENEMFVWPKMNFRVLNSLINHDQKKKNFF